MTDIANLVVKVDSTSATSASKALDDLTTSGRQASSAVGGVAASANQAAGNVGAVAQQAGTAAQQASRANTAFRAWAQGTHAAAGAAQTATTATAAHTAAVQANTGAVASGSARVQQSMRQAAAANGMYAKTANEIQFALRGLPAQFTDIAVSLQAGQNPLTVFLQQGGQLKDMFGGIGPAARAMGGYVLGLINPLSITLATITALAVAWHQGESEGTRFTKMIEMQGGTLGVTKDQMIATAEAMNYGAMTQGQAAAALSEVAASGKIAAGSFELVATAALRASKDLGIATEDTIKKFEDLAGDPVAAVAKLNEAERFLTLEVYNQIKALEEQGHTQEAARVATEAYAEAVIDRANAVKENLGTLEGAWRSVGNVAKAAWDAMLDVGREESGAKKFNDLHTELVELEAELANTSDGAWYRRNKERRVAEIRRQMREISDANVEETKAANQRMVTQQANDAAIALDRETMQFRSNQEKRTAEITRIRGEANAAILNAQLMQDREAGEKLEASLRANLAIAEKGIAEKYKDRKTPKSDADRAAEKALRDQQREYERLDRSVVSITASLNEELSTTENLSSAQRFITRTLAELTGEYSHLSKEQKDKVRADLEEIRALDHKVQVHKQYQQLLKDGQRLENDIAVDTRRRATEADREIRSMTRGSQQNDFFSRTDRISDKAAEARLSLQERTGKLHSENTQEYLRQLAMIDEAERNQLENEERHYRRRQEIQGDWRNGARRAMEDIETAVNDVAGKTYDGWMSAFSSLNQEIDNFAANGEFRIKNFAKVVIAELLKVQLQIALTKMVSGLFGGAMGYSDGGGYGSLQGMGNFNLPPQTGVHGKGAAYEAGSEISFNAKGTVLNHPTYMRTATGRAIGGEAGPEGLLPLQRGPDGRLGVSAFGGGGQGSQVVVSISVHIDSSGNATQQTSGDDDALARQLGAGLESKVRDVLVQEQRQGGILWQMQNR